MSAAELKMEGLEKFLKALKSKPPVARIGILGGGTREEGKLTNAEVGAAHEFGTSKLPVRSFLRMPIADQLPKRLQNLGAVSKDTLKKVVQEKTLIPWLERIAIEGVATVNTAFDTRGFGAWIPSDMTHKAVKQTLVETQQLRDSITYDVKEGE
jgi:hypothetical protein